MFSSALSPVRLLPLLAVVATMALTPAAHAAKGGGGGQQSAASGLTLSNEYISNSPNPYAPTWCLNEDDWHVRTWTGSLSGQFGATEQLCDPAVDSTGGPGWDAGGIGLQADIVVAGTLTDLAIVSPNGDSHHAVFVDSTTSKGTTLNHYQVCYVPPYMRDSDVATASLPGGTWQIALSGQVTKVSYTLRARMADVAFQQSYCPAAQQNLH